jgi:hypothetical protein
MMSMNPDNWNVPSVKEIDQAREERGIAKTHFSLAIGYQTQAGWGNLLRQGCNPSVTRIQKAVKALEYYDEHGIIPMPGEI